MLETLTVVIRADAQAAALWEPQVSPAVLRLWAANAKDPLLALDTAEVLQSLAEIRAALPSLQVCCRRTTSQCLLVAPGVIPDCLGPTGDASRPWALLRCSMHHIHLF